MTGDNKHRGVAEPHQPVCTGILAISPARPFYIINTTPQTSNRSIGIAALARNASAAGDGHVDGRIIPPSWSALTVGLAVVACAVFAPATRFPLTIALSSSAFLGGLLYLSTAIGGCPASIDAVARLFQASVGVHNALRSYSFAILGFFLRLRSFLKCKQPERKVSRHVNYDLEEGQPTQLRFHLEAGLRFLASELPEKKEKEISIGIYPQHDLTCYASGASAQSEGSWVALYKTTSIRRFRFLS